MNTPKTGWTALFAGLALLLTAAMPASAKPTAKPKIRTTTVKPAAAHGPKSIAHGPKSTPKMTTHGPSAKARGQAVKPTKVAGPAGTGAGKTKVKANASGKTARTDRKAARTDRVSSTTDPISATDPVTQSKVQRLLEKNDNLRNKLAARLPADSKLTVAASAKGFRNLGQFVAAVNVSHNQGVDFFALKELMVGPQQMSLGQALQQLKGMDPTTATVIADTATATAQADVNGTTTPKAKRKGQS